MFSEPRREFDVAAGSDRVLRAWESKGADDTQPTVLLCPELGAIPEACPRLLNELHVVSWSQHGTEPATADSHVTDALAVLDAAGVDRSVVVGWSVGSAVAAALARRHPERVSGLLLLGGTPGTTLDGLLGSLGVPVSVRRLVNYGSSRSLRLVGPLLDTVVRRVPANELSAQVLKRTGLLGSGADPAVVVPVLRRFLQREWLWYATLALALGGMPRASLRGIVCPLTVLVGRHDLLSDLKSLTEATGALPQAKLRILPTSHFIPLEATDEVDHELGLLLGRVMAVECARLGVEPPYPWQPV